VDRAVPFERDRCTKSCGGPRMGPAEGRLISAVSAEKDPSTGGPWCRCDAPRRIVPILPRSAAENCHPEAAAEGSVAAVIGVERILRFTQDDRGLLGPAPSLSHQHAQDAHGKRLVSSTRVKDTLPGRSVRRPLRSMTGMFGRVPAIPASYTDTSHAPGLTQRVAPLLPAIRRPANHQEVVLCRCVA
jgi:hypothetical protein